MDTSNARSRGFVVRQKQNGFLSHFMNSGTKIYACNAVKIVVKSSSHDNSYFYQSYEKKKNVHGSRVVAYLPVSLPERDEARNKRKRLYKIVNLDLCIIYVT